MPPGRGPPIEPDLWTRIESLFHQAAELEGAERAAFLRQACGDDLELERSLQRFLDADASTAALLDTSFDDLAGPLFTAADPVDGGSLEPGTMVGRYRVLGVLGSGGMSTVYRAERADGAFERQVALKMVRHGRLLGDAERRFERERRILARLIHPRIATLLDGGVTDDGRGFLVMELVEGVPLTRYAVDHDLGIEERLRLVVQVTEAVDHAHRNLVVHRDLKPSNILVRHPGEVKLLDFGVASLLDDGTASGSGEPLTRTGMHLMTPDYAAPEQIRGEAVTTATDVYAIGTLLYELLADRRPFGTVSARWSDLERVLDAAPPPLSRTDRLDRTTRRALGGDLENIVQKALHKDPLRRYPTAADLGADLRRHLEGRPVSARPDSVAYRFSKLVRRNRVASLALAALLAAVVLGAVGTLWQAREARLQAERGRAVGAFLFSLFEGADPDLRPGAPATVLELLEAGAERVDSVEAAPELRVDLLTTLGELFGKQGHYGRAETLLRRAVEGAHRDLRPGDPAIGRARHALGAQLAELGNLEEAEALLRSALGARLRDGSPPLDVTATRGALATAIGRRGRYAEAAGLFEAAIDELDEATRGDSASYASELMGLAQIYQYEDRLDEAEALFRSVRRLASQGGAETPFLAHATHNLGVVLADQERYTEARLVHLEALESWRRLFPRGHPEIARSLEAIGRVEERLGNWTAADSAYQEAIAGWSALYGSDNTQVAAIRANQANLRYFAGDFDAAAEAYREGVRIWRANDERRLLSAGLRNLGVIERERADLVSADTLFAEALRIRREVHGDDHVDVAEVHSSIAGLRNRQGRHAEAEESAREALRQYLLLLEPDHRLTLNARMQLGEALAAQRRFTEARPILELVFERFAGTLNPADAQRGRAGLWLGVVLAGAGERDRALILLRDAVPILEAALGEDAPETRRALQEISRLRG